MNELQLSKDLNVITAEIQSYMSELGKASFKIGELQLGKNATLKEIANLVSHQMDLPYEVVLKAMLFVEGGVFDEWNCFNRWLKPNCNKNKKQ